MAEDIAESPQRGGFDTGIKSAQAQFVLGGLSVSLAANSFIAISMATLLWQAKANPLIAFWLAFILTVNFGRFIVYLILRRLELAKRRPQFVLDILTVGALIGGLSWSFVPIALSNVAANGHDSYVVFIITGISAGALIQNSAYARVSIAFVTPPLIALDVILLFAGDLTGWVVAINAVLLTTMMIRSSFQGEGHFRKSERNAMEAKAMAESLISANADITNANQRLEIMANRDALTGLHNRASFNACLNKRLAAISSNETSEVALAVFDLDRFKTINDSLGHAAGDKLLVEFSEMLKKYSDPTDIIARIGGDEFAAIMTGQNVRQRAVELSKRVIAAMSLPVIIGDTTAMSGSSVGVAFAPEHSTDSDSLYTCADMALYAAKENGRSRFHIFDQQLSDRITRQRKIESLLPGAIQNKEIHAFFQPQASLKTGEVLGFEALARWQHPDLGEIPPIEINSAAANTQLARQITDLMAREACTFLKLLSEAGYNDKTIAVNISPREFSTYSPATMLTAIVAEFGVDARSIEVEITEESLFDVKGSDSELRALKGAGFQIAVDDFGMGHASLSYLVDFKVDRLKIDRNFVHGIAASRPNQVLVTALLNVGSALDLDILVEGVETDEDAEKLIELGCDEAQGYLFSRPMPKDAAISWLSARG